MIDAMNQDNAINPLQDVFRFFIFLLLQKRVFPYINSSKLFEHSSK